MSLNLQQLERIRRDFVANVSHELRTPLTVLHGYLELLLDEQWDEPKKNMFTQMQQQTVRMENLIEDLLLLSTLENEDVAPTEHKSIDVPNLVDTICREAKTLSSGNHQFEINFDTNLSLNGNEKELRSLFSNLIFNAVKYTPSGGKIFVDWSEKNKKAYFSVKDTGIGIEAHHIPRLTERFYRVDPARSRASGGTGLGLAIAKHVLIRHEGKLEIKSQWGEGSVFTCIFPKGQYTITDFTEDK
ncbi:MAG TPA: ATP-binding protein [Gammaproteobacteria bacterium]|nr:ATP-binding protein [Gammaproteobacteria bacterium]